MLASRSDTGDGELASRQLLADVLLGSLRVEAPQMIGLVDLGLAAGDLQIPGASERPVRTITSYPDRLIAGPGRLP